MIKTLTTQGNSPQIAPTGATTPAKPRGPRKITKRKKAQAPVVAARLDPEDRAALEAQARAAGMGICSYAATILATHVAGEDRTPRLHYDKDPELLEIVRGLYGRMGMATGLLKQAMICAEYAGADAALAEYTQGMEAVRAQHAEIGEMIDRLVMRYRTGG